MPACLRLNDICSGHDCFPPRAASSGSDNVFINSLPAHRLGDSWQSHECTHNPKIHGSHSGSLSSGSSSVFVNNKNLGRIGDKISCGSSAASGSLDVFAGD